MTRDEMRAIRERKKEEKIQARLQKKEERKELKGWNEMVKRAKLKDAWIEDETI